MAFGSGLALAVVAAAELYSRSRRELSSYTVYAFHPEMRILAKFMSFGVPRATVRVQARLADLNRRPQRYRRAYVRGFKQLVNRTRLRGQRLIGIAFHPRGQHSAVARFRALCRSNGVEFLDLRFVGEHYLARDAHLSPAGNRFLAEALAGACSPTHSG